MTTTLIGFDRTGTACVKVTKGNFDPYSTPDSERHKFLFNSKFSDQIEVAAIDLVGLNSGRAATRYIPPSANKNSFQRRFFRDLGIQYYHYRNSYFPDLRYDLPLFNIIWKRRSDGRFTQAKVVETNFGMRHPVTDRQGGYWATGGAGDVGWGQKLQVLRYKTAGTTLNFGTQIEIFAAGGQPASNMNKSLVVWNLPGLNVGLDGQVSGAGGKLAVEISATQCRVAKPGFDVRTATRRQMAFDALRHSPVKILAADDIAIPAGASGYDIGFPVPANTVADVHFYERGGAIQYPGPARDTNFGADYWFSGNSLRFANSGPPCRARFIVIAFDDSPPSNGNGNRVLEQFTWQGENHVRFLRPGAGRPARFADIALDTRWPALQILKEGYIPVGAGSRSYPIAFNSAGTFPFIKYMTVHGPGRTDDYSAVQYDRLVRQPYTKILKFTTGSFASKNGGDSTFVTYNGSSATFRTFRGNPVSVYYQNDGGDVKLVRPQDPSPIIGIRYFVFGIPR